MFLKLYRFFIIYLVPISCFSQLQIDSVINIKDSTLIRSISRLYPQKNVVSNKNIVIKSHIDSLIQEVSNLILSNGKLQNEKIKLEQNLLSLNISNNDIISKYKDSLYIEKNCNRVDTILFESFLKFPEISSINRIKVNSIIYINNLLEFNNFLVKVIKIDLMKIIEQIKYLETYKDSWSGSQKTYIDKVILNSKYNIAYLELAKQDFYEILKNKKIEYQDLVNLKNIHIEAIQQKYIYELIEEFSF